MLLVFMSLILASAIMPIVRWGKRYRLPAPLTIGLVYVLLIFVIAVMFAVIVPPLVKETLSLLAKTSTSLGIAEISLNGFGTLEVSDLAGSLQQYSTFLGQISGSLGLVLELVTSTFSALLVSVSLLVMTFYLLLSMDDAALAFAWMLPGDKEGQIAKAKRISRAVQHQLGSWVRGQLTLMLVVGASTYIGLLILGIPYALPLAILAGLLEILPNLGPTLAAIPAIAVAFFLVNPVAGMLTLIFTILVQQLENSLFVPQIMKGAVDVRPLTTLILILVGFKLMGVAGALLIVPFYVMIRSICRELWPDKGPFSEYTTH